MTPKAPAAGQKWTKDGATITIDVVRREIPSTGPDVEYSYEDGDGKGFSDSASFTTIQFVLDGWTLEASPPSPADGPDPLMSEVLDIMSQAKEYAVVQQNYPLAASILNTMDKLKAIRESVAQLDRGEGIPLSDIYQRKAPAGEGLTDSLHRSLVHLAQCGGLEGQSPSEEALLRHFQKMTGGHSEATIAHDRLDELGISRDNDPGDGNASVWFRLNAALAKRGDENEDEQMIQTVEAMDSQAVARAALEIADEKLRRVYYQSIVYDVCNLLDKGRPHGEGVVCGSVHSPHRGVQEAVAEILGKVEPYGAKHITVIADLRSQVERMRGALKRVERWGPFPEAIGRDGKLSTYGVEYGSNGERDYMRGIARAALALVPPVSATKDLEGVEPCCECGNEYPRRDLIVDGEVYCPTCRKEKMTPPVTASGEGEVCCTHCKHCHRILTDNEIARGSCICFPCDPPASAPPQPAPRTDAEIVAIHRRWVGSRPPDELPMIVPIPSYDLAAMLRVIDGQANLIEELRWEKQDINRLKAGYQEALRAKDAENFALRERLAAQTVTAAQVDAAWSDSQSRERAAKSNRVSLTHEEMCGFIADHLNGARGPK